MASLPFASFSPPAHTSRSGCLLKSPGVLGMNTPRFLVRPLPDVIAEVEEGPLEREKKVMGSSMKKKAMPHEFSLCFLLFAHVSSAS